MTALINLVGQKFNRLKVKAFAGKKNKKRYWDCVCDCGNRKQVETSHLKNGHTKSCGCLNIERIKERSFKHGMIRTRFYAIWINMRTRCNNKLSTGFENYGGRGLKICKRWNDFKNFKEDLLGSYSKHVEQFEVKNTSIDRVNNSGGYSKKNCRWSTAKEQSCNRRSNVVIEYKGKKLLISQWAKEKGIGRRTLKARVKAEWLIKDALNIKPKLGQRIYDKNKNR